MIGSRCILTLVLLAFALIAPVQLAAQKDGFAAWLQALRQDALKKGISTQTLDVALADAAPIERVLQLQERQPESRLSWAEYGKRVVSQDRILRGRRQMEQQRELLHAIASKYGVQPRFLVAL